MLQALAVLSAVRISDLSRKNRPFCQTLMGVYVLFKKPPEYSKEPVGLAFKTWVTGLL